MNRKTAIIFITACAAALVLAAAISVAEQTEEFHKTIPGGGKNLDVSLVNGTVRIASWDSSSIQIDAVKRTNKSAGELDKVEIIVKESGRDLSIAAEKVHSLRNYPKVIVDMTIRVPRDAKLIKIRTVNGNINCNAVVVDGLFRSVNGNITCDDLTGSVSASTTNGNIALDGDFYAENIKTTNGSITVNLNGLTDDCDIHTVNGSAEISLSRNSDLRLEFKTVNGKFSGSFDGIRDLSIDRRRLTGYYGDGNPGLTISTVNGDIAFNR